MMQQARRQKAIQKKLERRRGMSPEQAALFSKQKAKWTDWHGQCRICRTTRTGSLAELSGPCPNCGAGDD